jgi:hypothetical protein
LARVVLEAPRSAAVDEVRNRYDQRRVGPYARLAVVLNGELRERASAVLSRALRDRLVDPLDLALAAQRAQLLLQVADVGPRVPDIERLHRGELADRLSVLTD